MAAAVVATGVVAAVTWWAVVATGVAAAVTWWVAAVFLAAAVTWWVAVVAVGMLQGGLAATNPVLRQRERIRPHCAR